MKRLYAVLFLLGSSCPVLASSGDDICAALNAASLPNGGTALVTSHGAKSYKDLFDECDSADTFAGAPLPLHAGKPLKCSTDKNHVENLVKFSDGTVAFTAKAAVDADGSKLACKTGWPNQCGTWLQFDRGSTRKDVDAEETPFIVVPGAMKAQGISFDQDTGVGPGDLAVAYTNGKCSFGVVGDSGPYFRLGEISLRSQADLGNAQCKTAGEHPCTAIRDVGIGRSVHYLIFPHSRPAPLTSDNVNDVAGRSAQERAKTFLQGLTR